jgi:hypothetical protein
MKRLLVTVLCLILSLSLSGCSSKAEEGAAPDNSQKSTLGPNAVGANGLPLLPDEAAEGACFAVFHLKLDWEDPANYDENYNYLYPDEWVINTLDAQALWNEIKWMDEKFGTTFSEFALEMGKASVNRSIFGNSEARGWCIGRSARVNDGSP